VESNPLYTNEIGIGKGHICLTLRAGARQMGIFLLLNKRFIIYLRRDKILALLANIESRNLILILGSIVELFLGFPAQRHKVRDDAH
jgi:hypothetical protein